MNLKTRLKEQGLYLYTAGFLSLMFLIIVLLRFVFDVEVVSFETFIVLVFMLMVALTVAAVGIDVVMLKRRLKSKGK